MLKIYSIICFFVFLPFYSFAWRFEEVNSWIPPYRERNLETSGLLLPYILKELPALRSKISYIKLCELPTPVGRLAKLGDRFGVKNLYFKDDGINSPCFGGNKVRKLEFLIADALYSGAKTIITVGDAGSNCVLATLAQSKRTGFREIYCLLGPQLNASYLRRNLLLDLFYGGIISYYNLESEQTRAIWELSDALRDKGKWPYMIGFGATCPIGFLGYMNAAFELKEQIKQGLLPEPDYIYVPLGSAGTAGGLILGIRLAGLKSVVVPVAISGKNGDAYYRTEELVERINETINFFYRLTPTVPRDKFVASDLEYRNNFADCAYAEITEEVAQGLQELYSTEGIKLEGTYTGKALAAMIYDVQHKEELKDKNILLWNTFCYGTFEELTSAINYKDLPQELHFYFEQDVQPLDGGL